MDTIPPDFRSYFSQVGLKKVMDGWMGVVEVLSGVVLEDGELKVGLIV
jgi:hypothetical protein